MSWNPLEGLAHDLFSLKTIVEYAAMPDWSTQPVRLDHLYSTDDWDFVLDSEFPFTYVISSRQGRVVVPLGKAAPANGYRKNLKLLLTIPGLKRIPASSPIADFEAPGQWFNHAIPLSAPVEKAAFNYDGASVSLCLASGAYYLVVSRPKPAG